MSRIEVFSRRPFAKRFSNFLAEGPMSLRVVSPFVTAMRPWSSVAAFFAFAQRRGIEVIELVTRPPEKRSSSGVLTPEQAEALAQMGISLKIRDTDLHSKIYFFEYADPPRSAAIVGSANFTKGGFEVNDESVVVVQHPEDLPQVRKEVDRLCGYGSFPYAAWRARNFDR